MNDPNHNIIRCNEVTVRYGRVTALESLSLEIPCGSLTALVGPNGAGKSTFLRALLGWHRPDSGEIRIGDSHPQHALPRLAYLPQRQAIDWDFPITVREVVEQGRYAALRLGRGLSETDHKRVDRALAELDLGSFAKRQLRQLSGGQQQRAFLARALAQGADIFLLDEPFAGLDRFACTELTHILLAWQAQGRTVLAAVHDVELARRHFVYGLLLAKRLLAFGPVNEALSEANLDKAFASAHCVHEPPLPIPRTASFPD